MQRALEAVRRFNNKMQRKGMMDAQIRKEENGEYTVVMSLHDETGSLMRLELPAPSMTQARVLARAYEKQADSIYQMILTRLLAGTEDSHADI